MALVQRLVQPLVLPLAAQGAFNQLIQPRLIQQRLRAAVGQTGTVVALGDQPSKTVEFLNRRLMKRDQPIRDYLQVAEADGGALRVYRNASGEAVALGSWRRGLFGQERERLLMVADHRQGPTLLEQLWFEVNRHQTTDPQWRIRQKASLFNVWAQLRGESGAPRHGFRALPYAHLQSEMVNNLQTLARRQPSTQPTVSDPSS